MKTITLTLVIGALLPVQLLFAQSQIADSFKDPTPNAEGVLATGFVPCSGITCDLCDFMVMANTIIKWLFGMAFLFFAVLAVRAGFKLVTEGNPGALQAAKQSFANASIGLIIFLCAWLLIDTLLRTVLKGGTGEIDGWGPWTQVKCVAQRAATTKAMFDGDDEFSPETDTYNGGAGLPPGVLASIGSGNTAVVAFAQKMDAINCQYSQQKRNGCQGNPAYTDCSDLVNNAYQAAGCSSPGVTTESQYSNSRAVPKASAPLSTLKPGDAIVYREATGAAGNHVVICMNSGCTQVIHASGTKDDIKVSNSSYYYGQTNAKILRASDFCR